MSDEHVRCTLQQLDRQVTDGPKYRMSPWCSGIPSFYTVCHLSFVCHDLLDPIVLFQQHGLRPRDSLGDDELRSISGSWMANSLI